MDGPRHAGLVRTASRTLLMAQTAAAVRLGLRLGLAHHPLCTAFQRDVVRIGGLHVCGGCLATWPAFFLALPIWAVVRLEGAAPWALVAAGVALGLPHFATYRWQGGVAMRRAAKSLGATGLAAVVVGGLTAGLALGWVLLALLAGVAATLALQTLRFRSILATCDACPYRRDWDGCPGFNRTAPGVAIGTADAQAPRPLT